MRYVFVIMTFIVAANLGCSPQKNAPVTEPEQYEEEFSGDIQDAYARYEAAKKQVEETVTLLIQTRRKYQPTSSPVADVEERLEAARTDLRKIARTLDKMLESQILTRQSAYEELVKELQPSADQVQNLQEEINSLKQRQTEVKSLLTDPNPGDVTTNSIDMKLVRTPPGEFTMGSPLLERLGSDEGPRHRVRISKGFWMGQFEVTQAQWRAVMGNNPSYFKGDNLPVEQVDWNDAMEFCWKLSQKEGRIYRLPTEAEWEYACRAGTTTAFSTGKSISTDQANYNGNYKYGGGRTGEGVYREKTIAVGSFSPNAFGLYDMHGNVWEWCQDFWGHYTSGRKVDPKGSSGSRVGRVVRGGAWSLVPWDCRSGHRYASAPDYATYTYGFRIVCPDF